MPWVKLIHKCDIYNLASRAVVEHGPAVGSIWECPIVGCDRQWVYTGKRHDGSKLVGEFQPVEEFN